LIEISEQALGRAVAERSGVFRPAILDQQKKDFFLRSERDGDAIWQEHPLFGPGIWIPKGVAVYSKLYLEGLWRACSRGASLKRQDVSSLADLASFDRIVLCTGASSLRFPECQNLPLSVTKGQSLICRWPEKLPCSVASQGHITPTEDPTLCQIGSTYEHGFSSLDPDPQVALGLIDKAALFYPPASRYSVLEIRSGGRIAPIQGYIPLVQQIAPKAWIFTGLGSRGMLYHALLSSQLIDNELVK
jgi:glycine/D-amino acid oxidase-like deaminating enzyme